MIPAIERRKSIEIIPSHTPMNLPLKIATYIPIIATILIIDANIMLFLYWIVSRTYHQVIIIKRICVTSVTQADPINEYIGIKIRFPIIFRRAIIALIHIIRDCSPRAIKIYIESDEMK